MDRMKVEIIVTCLFCVAVLLLNLWTMNRAQKVEERIKRILSENEMLCPLCGDHYRDSKC